MKLRAIQESVGMRVEIAGDVEGAGCDCLAHFWDHYIPDGLHQIAIDLGMAKTMDDAAAQSLADLIAGHLAAGARVTVVRPPAVLVGVLEGRHATADQRLDVVPRGDGNDAP